MTAFQNLVGSHHDTVHLKAIAPDLDTFDSVAEPYAHLASGAARTRYDMGCQTFVGKYCVADGG
tara:strand:+ start:2190 stop:2381 length:192 start_codon:yes stop_codon:yes gene_type:complete